MAESSTGMSPTAGGRKKRSMPLNRDSVIRRLNNRQQDRKPSPLVLLKEIFEEAKDKGRFVGDTMFWKYFEDIDTQRVLHTNSVEFRNLKLMFWETCFYVVVLLVITAYVYTVQSMDVYNARQQQQDYWAGCDATGRCKIRHVEDVSSFWLWMHGEFVERAYTAEDGQPARPVANISVPFGSNDFPVRWNPRFVGPSASSVLLGTVRLRQLRARPNDGCEVSRLFSHYYPDCFGSFRNGRQDRRSYPPRFAPTYLRTAFDWRDSEQTRQVPMLGDIAAYGAGGFIVDLPVNRSSSATMIADLWHWHWVDRATRAVIVELSVLNINVNVIVNSRVLFEFGPTGSTHGSVVSSAARVPYFTPSLDAGGPSGFFAMQLVILLAMLAYTGLTLWMMYKTCRGFLGERPFSKMKEFGCLKSMSFLMHTAYHYFRYGWNLVDLAILLLFYIHMGYRIEVYAAKGREPALEPNVIGHPEMFMPFSRVMATLTIGNNILALMALLAWGKLFKYLCMSSYFRLLVRILEKCAARLAVFSVVLLVIFFGFSIAFYTGRGSNDEAFTSPWGSFLVLFFMLIDGYALDERWFGPGREQLMPFIFFCYIAVIYFVLLNIFVAVVLDVYATTRRDAGVLTGAANPMAVFLHTYWSWMKGISNVRTTTDHNLKKEDLSIQLGLLPGIVRRKWVEKKRKMQQVASENFQGMDLFPDEGNLQISNTQRHTDWALPSSRLDVMEQMQTQGEQAPVPMYEIPPAMLQGDVSRDQLQRLMDEDSTLPVLLGSDRAVDVIRRFRARDGVAAPNAGPEATEGEADSPLRRLQGYVFSRVDELERVRFDQEEVPNVKEINDLANEMSGAITDVRNQFRMELTGIIEATGALFEHLVDLTQGMNSIRQNHEDVTAAVRQRYADAANR